MINKLYGRSVISHTKEFGLYAKTWARYWGEECAPGVVWLLTFSPATGNVYILVVISACSRVKSNASLEERDSNGLRKMSLVMEGDRYEMRPLWNWSLYSCLPLFCCWFVCFLNFSTDKYKAVWIFPRIQVKLDPLANTVLLLGTESFTQKPLSDTFQK